MAVYFPNTRFLFDHTSSWVELPSSLLALRGRGAETTEGSSLEGAAPISRAASEGAEFIYALKRALRTHLSEGYPDLDFAAQIMRMSVRTLQRNLARAGLTYSKVVEYARFEVAVELLKNPDLKIIEIAYALGYQDPSHFSRAFRRIAGQTPRQFREKVYG